MTNVHFQSEAQVQLVSQQHHQVLIMTAQREIRFSRLKMCGQLNSAITCDTYNVCKFVFIKV